MCHLWCRQLVEGMCVETTSVYFSKRPLHATNAPFKFQVRHSDSAASSLFPPDVVAE
jgi:hypothetical protein